MAAEDSSQFDSFSLSFDLSAVSRRKTFVERRPSGDETKSRRSTGLPEKQVDDKDQPTRPIEAKQIDRQVHRNTKTPENRASCSSSKVTSSGREVQRENDVRQEKKNKEKHLIRELIIATRFWTSVKHQERVEKEKTSKPDEKERREEKGKR